MSPPLVLHSFATGLDGEEDRILWRVQGQPSPVDVVQLQPAAGLHPRCPLLLLPQSRFRR